MVGGRLLRAQQQPLPRPPQPTFTTKVDVVNVFVTVRDKQGRIVRDLSKEEFSLEEDGRPQKIGFFFRESDLPLTVGLLVDTTPSESNMLEVERTASLAFLTRVLRPEMDKAFLIQYYSQVDLLQNVTSSRGKLEDALNQLEAHGTPNRKRGWGTMPPPASGGAAGQQDGKGQGPQGGPGPGGYENALSDAVYLASEEIMRRQEGRKALFILGDGDHLGDRGEEAIAAAERADTLIYSIRIFDERQAGGSGFRIGLPVGGSRGGGMGGPGGFGGGPGGGPGGPSGETIRRGKDNLQKLSKQTGGGYFEVGKKQTLDQIYGEIEEELRSQYDLGYTPEPNAVNGYRRIKVGVQRKGLVVRGREGYYAPAK